jgi:hypothetical protein
MAQARPEIIGTIPPQAATIGASISETLSPTPPVECLSSTGPLAPGQSMTVPESRIASVKATASSGCMPRKNTAMANAATWPSVTDPAVRPSTRKAISSGESFSPSRFLRMTSCGRSGAPVAPLRQLAHPRASRRSGCGAAWPRPAGANASFPRGTVPRRSCPAAKLVSTEKASTRSRGSGRG